MALDHMVELNNKSWRRTFFSNGREKKGRKSAAPHLHLIAMEQSFAMAHPAFVFTMINSRKKKAKKENNEVSQANCWPIVSASEGGINQANSFDELPTVRDRCLSTHLTPVDKD